MNFEQDVSSVLLVSSSEKLTSSLTSLLPGSAYFPVHKVKNISAAERMLAERDYDYVIISSPLPDDAGIEFAMDTGRDTLSLVLFLVATELYEEIYEKVSPAGVFTIAKPVTRQTFELALKWLAVVKFRSRKVQKKTLSLEEKMAEIRIVNRAKLLLISEEKMNEDSAHRYIEKQAMDHCRSKKEIAESIISRYTEKN